MSQYSPDELEREVLAQWEREQTFARSVELRTDAPRFSFYDGPPYATGSPHYGHMLQTSIKDAITRFWTMRGYRVDRRVGWDCHGLPVENMVEKELGLESKKDIEAKGIEEFNALCRSFVLRKVDEWTNLLRRMGRWADYSQAYRTMDSPFIESAWWVLKTVWDRGLVYKGMRSSPYCPRCETPLSNFETAQGYREVSDPAITVKLPLTNDLSTFLLVWTTTPWTLPANAAVAVHPDLQYVRVRVGDEYWILVKERIEAIISENYTIEEEFPGSVLVDRTYKQLYNFDYPQQPRPTPDMLPGKAGERLKKPPFRVVAAPFVSANDGTGLVHVAPAFGEEDFRLAEGNREWLDLIVTVDGQGRFLPFVTPWAGQFVKDADPAIIADLKERGLLVRSETIRHEYPHCWRCETPLLYMATTSWYIAVTKVKEQLVKNAEQIQWIPGHLKEGRFGQGLRDAPDWAVSRSRFWGVPLPVWECGSCEKPTIIGSLQDLKDEGGDLSALKSPHADLDLHRPYVDRVVLRCSHCGGEARRAPEVLDVWFDSGSMPYGQWHYPFENKELVEATFPADFIGEALEMTRGWFYTLHVLAGILTLHSDKEEHPSTGLGVNRPAFKNVIASGLILAEDGRKLSKRFGNYPDPSGLVAKYGADTIRLYLLSATRLGEDMQFSDRLVGDLYRKFTLILWNVWQYYLTYEGAVGTHPLGTGQGAGTASTLHPAPSTLLDRWILARVAQLSVSVWEAMEQYRIDDAVRQLQPFVDDLSTWYVRRSRGREESLPVLREVLQQFALIAAPFIPFLAEKIYREITGASPHLQEFPFEEREYTVVGVHPSQRTLLVRMAGIRALASAGLRARAEVKIKVRQPLAEAVLVGTFPALEEIGEEGVALLRDELNVKRVILSGAKDLGLRDSSSPSAPQNDKNIWVDVPGGKLGLNTELTEDLRQEGIVRDLIRQMQDLRKKAGYRITDSITTSLVTEDETIRVAIARWGETIKKETKSREIRLTEMDAEQEGILRFGSKEVRIGVKR